MKLKNIYSLMAGALMLFAACSPDDYNLDGQSFTKDQLNYPEGYSLDLQGNRVILASKISGCNPLWITPSGRSQEPYLTLELPFAGDYNVTFGVDTKNGAQWGDPHPFTLEQNDFSLLSNPLWFYLADKDYTGGELPSEEKIKEGLSKRWYPNNSDYGLGCTGPVMYIAPYDPTGSNNYTEEEENNLVYKDVPFGRANWKPNWDPGFQSWLIPEDNAYMISYMDFSMDAEHGCVANMYRGNYETTDNITSDEKLDGKFMLELTDKNHPTISFTDCYAMHSIGFDDVCSNYTQNIIIGELTPYYMALITKRTNSEGNWYIVWNFVSEEVINTKGACIPASEASYLATSTPVLPTYTDLENKIFTVENNGVTYIGNQNTYTVDTDAPYDFYWWNSAEGANAWQSLLTDSEGNVTYNNSWAPMPDDASYDGNELVLEKKERPSTMEKTDEDYYDYPYIAYTYGDYTGKVTIKDNKLTFSKPVTFVTATNDFRTVSVTGKEFTILKETAAEGMTIGVPNSYDSKGNVNSYTCVNLNVKAIGSTSGPTIVDLSTDYTGDGMSCLEQNKYYRLVFYNAWNSGKGLIKDISKVKLKKGQKLTVKFTLKDASKWSSAPKCAICENCINSTWEPDCYNLSEATTVNLAGETTVTLTNTSGTTAPFSSGSLQLSIQLDGYYKDFDGTTVPDIIQSVSMSYE